MYLYQQHNLIKNFRATSDCLIDQSRNSGESCNCTSLRQLCHTRMCFYECWWHAANTAATSSSCSPLSGPCSKARPFFFGEESRHSPLPVSGELLASEVQKIVVCNQSTRCSPGPASTGLFERDSIYRR